MSRLEYISCTGKITTMTKPVVILLALIFNVQLINSQQWVDKKYEYDSLLNISYGTAINFNGAIDTLKMDIFLPICDDTSPNLKRPLMMWIHGGSFLAGDKNDPSIQSMCKNFAKRGYVTASIDYRLGFIADDVAWNCNYENYECIFATDSIDWSRAYYRAVQDAKGALRFLINRNEEYRIDTDNIFVAGESAGSFVALGVGLLDTIEERPIHSFAVEDAPAPDPNALACIYNQGQIFNGSSITRPDLGGIDGDIEPTNIPYTIKGIGNMYGAMLSDLLKHIPDNKTKPAIYSFHQPCDIIVPLDSNYVYWGLSWCFTNGYGCYGITNNEIMLYGSRTFSNWNSNNDYGYIIQNEFTSVDFPYSFLFEQGSCADQINNPCHAYDNRNLRENNLALFFSDKITSNPICDTSIISEVQKTNIGEIKIYPNPTFNFLYLNGDLIKKLEQLSLYNILSEEILTKEINENEITLDLSYLTKGVYLLQLIDKSGNSEIVKIIKE